MAAMANDATMAECSDLMEEMRAVYTCPSDATAVRESQGAFKALSAAYTAQRDGLARSIREWTQRATEAEARATPPEPEGEHARRVHNLSSTQEQVQGNVEQLGSQFSTLEHLERELRTETNHLTSMQEQLETLELRTIPDAQYELSLFAHISGINWHYEEAANYKGHVSNVTKGSVTPFDLDPQQTSEIDATNQLWAMIE